MFLFVHNILYLWQHRLMSARAARFPNDKMLYEQEELQFSANVHENPITVSGRVNDESWRSLKHY